jgi:hypothetical protein
MFLSIPHACARWQIAREPDIQDGKNLGPKAADR